MSVEALEFIVIIVGAFIIIGAVAELWKLWLRYTEERRENHRREHRARKWKGGE